MVLKNQHIVIKSVQRYHQGIINIGTISEVQGGCVTQLIDDFLK